MNSYPRLLAKVLLVTAAFALLLFASIVTTTLTFQNHIHPDSWTTTAYDIAGGVVVAVLYVAVVARMIYNFAKVRSRNAA